MTKVCHCVSHIKRVQCLFGLSTTPILLPAAVLRGRSHPGGCLARIHSHLHTIRKAQTGLKWKAVCISFIFKIYFHTMFSTYFDFIVFSLQIIWRGTLSKMWNNIFSLFSETFLHLFYPVVQLSAKLKI